MPLSCPTQTVAASCGPIAIVLMFAPTPGLTERQRGPALSVLGAFALVVSHRLSPPASMRFALFGSSTKGAMNSAFWFIASGMRKGSAFHDHSLAAGFQNWPLM